MLLHNWRLARPKSFCRVCVFGGQRQTLLVIISFLSACALPGCGNSEKKKEGRAQLMQRVTEQLETAKAKAQAYDFDGAGAILRGLAEEVDKSPFADSATYDKLTANIDGARRSISDQEWQYRKKIREGWKVIDGRLVSPADQERALAETRRLEQEEAKRREADHQRVLAETKRREQEEAKRKEEEGRLVMEAAERRRRQAQAEAQQKAVAEAAAKAKFQKAMRETLSVGYTSYCVWRAWYSDRLSSNQFLDKRPNAKWLFLDISVQNDDNKARMIPPFKLIDENGAEYERSAQGTMVENAIDFLESLNPGVTKQGFLVFDVPETHQYWLKVSGGYWSLEYGFVRIVPGSK